MRTYLRQFLSDPRVIDEARRKWNLILNLFILPQRAPKVAKLYQEIWTDKGSPLLVFSRELQNKLQNYFDAMKINIVVELGMTYGNPSVVEAVENLIKEKVDKIIVLPLFPQYSSSTTAAVFDVFVESLKKYRRVIPFDFVYDYHKDPYYIQALAKTVNLQEHQFLLFSFHGIPLRYMREGDVYSKQCYTTAELVAKKLGLSKQQWGIAFQSRFGKEERLKPYTDEFLKDLADQGTRNVAVICPGFAVDCLETLEEIKKRAKEVFFEF